MKIELPENVKFIIDRLADNGYEAFAVGGCIRDSLLGKAPDDWDITTSALPGQIKELFSHTVDTGIQHGTVTVVMDGENFEVTTYRIDGEYEDNRHPKEVVFTANLLEDLKRRDFTINAMAYNSQSGLVDEFDGVRDLENKTVRCVGNPMERFQEDALRVLRGVRFAAQLGFALEMETERAMERMAPNLANISAERIQAELVKLVTSSNPDMLRAAYNLGITKIILPELDEVMEIQQNNPHHIYSVGEHTLHALRETPPDKSLRLAVLLHDLGKADTGTVDESGISHFYNHNLAGEKKACKILRRLKFDNNTINKVARLVRWHDYRFDLSLKSMRRSIYKIGEDIFEELLEVMRADVLAQSSYLQREKLEELQEIKSLFNRIKEEGNCLSIKDLAVNGNDLIGLGVARGPKIGEVLNYLLDTVLDEPEKNVKDILIGEAKEYITD